MPLTKIQKFAKKNKGFWWYIKSPENLSMSAIVEGTFNSGDFKDVQELIKIIGVKKAKEIFTRQIKKPRNNYSKKTVNFFKLYFDRYGK